MESETILTIRNVSKSFGPTHALKAVSFDLRRGEIHAVAGENGAGKSTLMNVIDGIVRPDSGEILFDGRPVEITSPAVAQKLGIGFVHQEIELCPDVTVAENMFMAATNSSRSWLMDYAALERRAGDVLRQLGDVDPRALVRDLSISNQQLVEIAKALTLDCRVLILDEPTAALTEREAQTLFGIMRRLAARGISIIYISHRLAEIFDNCDRVSVFRDGEHIVTRNVAETTPPELVNSMVGRVLDSQYPDKQREEDRSSDVILSVHGLTERRRFRDISFEVKAGEILGLAGLIGAGRSEIAKAICRLEGDVSGAGAPQGAAPQPAALSGLHRRGDRLPVRRPQGRRRVSRHVHRLEHLSDVASPGLALRHHQPAPRAADGRARWPRPQPQVSATRTRTSRRCPGATSRRSPSPSCCRSTRG